ncbi:DUF4838 domain-containing protein [Verrucomicrobiota bacterium]
MNISQKILLGFISLLLTCSAQGSVTLVKDGRPFADIIVETNALSSVKLAAEDLQEHIEKMSGAILPITNTPSDKFKCHVYVGPSEYVKKLGVRIDDLKAEGFKIIAKDNYLVLIGRDEQRKPFPYKRDPEGLAEWQKFAGEKYTIPGVQPGVFNKKLGFFTMDATATLYATSELLEQLGVRWYMPYENGTIIPKKKTIEVPDQNLKKEPVFPYREFCFYGAMRSDNDGVMWFKRLKYGASYVYYNNHTTWEIIGTKEQKEKHPEYYAMANGKRIGGMGARGTPRLSDPNFRKTSVNYMNKVLEAYPPLLTAALGMPDGFTQIDERDNAKWGRPGALQTSKFSDYVWDYWLFAAKELKKTHPDKYLACLAYSTYRDPPAGIDKLPDNVAITLCLGTANMAVPQGKLVAKTRDKWLSMLTSKKLFLWDYYLFYRTKQRPRYPVFFTKILQEEMQKLKGVCEGKFIEIAPEYHKGKPPNLVCPGLTHMTHYWQGKLYWDPDMDRKKMMDEYYELYFGPAKKEMKEFYEFAEEVWMRPLSRSVTMYSGFLKEPDVTRYFDILKRAREKAGKDTVYDKRIAQIETEMQPLKLFIADTKRVGPDFSASKTDLPVKIDGDLEKPFWKGATWYPMKELVKGEAVPAEKSASVAFRMPPDKSALIIGVKCNEPKMDKILAKAKYQDDFDIFEDDVVEIYLETPERSYFKIVINPEGKIWDETQDVTLVERDTLPALWNPGTEAAVKKEKDCWTAEIMIPTKDFGTKGPDKANPWGINVCRTRFAGDKPELAAISPTGKALYRVLSKLGNLSVK